jgi:hypothetical protein
MRMRSVLTHSAQAVAEGALIALLVVGLAAGTTFAAKGGGAAGGGKPGGGGSTSGGTLTGPAMVHDYDGNGASSYGDDITFNVSTSASKPQVGLRCYQGANFVYDGYVAFFDSWLSAPYFTLSSSYWNSTLDASCTARLFTYDSRYREQLLATPLTFSVAP